MTDLLAEIRREESSAIYFCEQIAKYAKALEDSRSRLRELRLELNREGLKAQHESR